MKIENLVKDCMMDVEFYAANLYDWERHHSEEYQDESDINKPRSSLKIFASDNGNVVHVLKSKHVVDIPEDIMIIYDDPSCNMMKELLSKEFYFCMLFKKGNPHPIFPNEIWLNLEAAVECCIKYL